MPSRLVRLPVLQPRAATAAPEVVTPARSDGRLTVAQAKSIAGSLGRTSKMPGFSFGISATRCITGSKLRNIRGSVCSGCYALTDWYRTWRPLLEGHRRRWNGLRHPQWVDAMVRMIDSACVAPNNWFRWHDSGDLQGVWHLENIIEVCRQTPGVRHWLPTREYWFVAAFLRGGGRIPGNLTVRLSAHMFDTEPVIPEDLVPWLAGIPVSTVSTVSTLKTGMQIVEGKGSIECRAVEARDNKCGPCRACWDQRVRSVNYPQH